MNFCFQYEKVLVISAGPEAEELQGYTAMSKSFGNGANGRLGQM